MAAAARRALTLVAVALGVSLFMLGRRYQVQTASVQDGVQAMSSTPESTIEINKAYIKYLWWPLLAYIFWGMAHVCDEYFVRTIEVISERFRIPDDVAGATLMALGCNGPEMALNTIAIFKPSDIGVGAVIGGEVFNVLVIIGFALLATPETYMPLRISNFSFFRDVMFYIASVAMLYAILRDGEISRKEALSLLGGAVVYSVVVSTSSMIREFFYRTKRRLTDKMFPPVEDIINIGEERRTIRGSALRASLRRSASIGEVLNGPRQTKQGEFGNEQADFEEGVADDSDFENEVEEDLVQAWKGSRFCTDPFVGSVLVVKVEVRSRMMDRVNRADERYMWITENALMVSAAVDPKFPAKQKGRACGLIYDSVSGWHHGGLVNAPDICDGDKLGEFGAGVIGGKQEMLLRASRVPKRAGILGLENVPCEAISLQNILYCDPVDGNPNMFTLSVHQDSHHGLGRLITLELVSDDASVIDSWLLTLRQHMEQRSLRTSAVVRPPPETNAALLRGWIEWLQFPVRTLAKMTIPDMDRPELQAWYPLAFTMSMTWLAVFAYLVVAACDGIHEDFGIPNGLLGFTIAAAGTSFPNVFSGMVVSRQGKTTMAIANALGANVQNVFLALAVPWTIQSCAINHGPFAMPVTGLEAQIAAIFVTLAPVVLIFLCCSCTFPEWAGYIFLATYVVYLTVALGQQSTGCMTWPVNCV